MFETEIRSVQFAEVDWSDTSCLISYGPLPEKLLLSVQAVGLLQKPLLRQKENGLLQIVCGSRRLAVCRELGLEPVDCQILVGSLSKEMRALGSSIRTWECCANNCLSHAILGNALRAVGSASRMRSGSSHCLRRKLMFLKALLASLISISFITL